MDTTPASDNPTEQTDLDSEFKYRFAAERFEDIVGSVVSDLRALADRIEAMRAPSPHQADPGFGDVAARLTREVMSALPNLGLSAVVHVAAQADTALLRDRLARSAPASATPTDSAPGSGGTGADVSEIAVGSHVISAEEYDLDGTAGTEVGYFGLVTALAANGYDVVWHNESSPVFVRAHEVVHVPAHEVPDDFTTRVTTRPR